MNELRVVKKAPEAGKDSDHLDEERRLAHVAGTVVVVDILLIPDPKIKHWVPERAIVEPGFLQLLEPRALSNLLNCLPTTKYIVYLCIEEGMAVSVAPFFHP